MSPACPALEDRVADAVTDQPSVEAARPSRDRIGAPLVIVAVLAAFAILPDLQAPQLVTWFVLILGIVAMAWYTFTDYVLVRWNAAAKLVGIYFGCQFVSVVHYGKFSDLFAAFIAGTVVSLIVMLSSSFTVREINRLINGILVIAAVELAFAFAEEYLHIKAPRGYTGGLVGSTFGTNPLLTWASGRTPGTLGHAIPLATLLTTAILLIMFAKRWHALVKVVFIGPLIYGVLLSGTRSAVACFVIAVAIGLCYTRMVAHPTAWRLVAASTAIVLAVTLNLGNLLVSSGLEGTGSLDHRVAALNAVSSLSLRAPSEVIGGSGYGSTKLLFNQGLLQTDGFFAIDNQFVTAFALAGLLGFGTLLLLIIFGFIRGNRSTRPAAIFLIAMFFSFDLLQWTFTLVLFSSLIAAGSQRASHKALSAG